MESPGSGRLRLCDLCLVEIAEIVHKTILLAVITHSVTEMVRKSREINFKIDGKRLSASGHGGEGFACPKGAAAEHGKDNFRFSALTHLLPVIRETRVGQVKQVVRIVGLVDPTQVMSDYIRLFLPQSVDQAAAEIRHDRKVIVLDEIDETTVTLSEGLGGCDFVYDPGVTLLLSLMINRPQTRVEDKQLRGIIQRLEISLRSTIREQQILRRTDFLPVTENGLQGGRRLMRD